MYAHICTNPASIVNGESPMTRLTLERLNAQRDSVGLINIPRNLEDIAGSESIACGGNYNIYWQKQ